MTTAVFERVLRQNGSTEPHGGYCMSARSGLGKINADRTVTVQSQKRQSAAGSLPRNARSETEPPGQVAPSRRCESAAVQLRLRDIR